MGKKIKDFTEFDFLKEQLDAHIYGNWIAIIAALFFFLIGAYGIGKGDKASLWMFAVSLMFIIGTILCYPRLKRLKKQIEKLKKEKERNEGIEEKEV
ncbi:MAG: hypothetical protein IJY05_04335 [Clostridia bacterium]|nr:hypothetical protein [Clostridia bacterium]